jgi:hypothetical protein
MRPGVYAARPAAARRAADQTQQRLDQNLGHHRQQLVGVVVGQADQTLLFAAPAQAFANTHTIPTPVMG